MNTTSDASATTSDSAKTRSDPCIMTNHDDATASLPIVPDFLVMYPLHNSQSINGCKSDLNMPYSERLHLPYSILLIFAAPTRQQLDSSRQRFV